MKKHLFLVLVGFVASTVDANTKPSMPEKKMSKSSVMPTKKEQEEKRQRDRIAQARKDAEHRFKERLAYEHQQKLAQENALKEQERMKLLKIHEREEFRKRQMESAGEEADKRAYEKMVRSKEKELLAEAKRVEQEQIAQAKLAAKAEETRKKEEQMRLVAQQKVERSMAKAKEAEVKRQEQMRLAQEQTERKNRMLAAKKEETQKKNAVVAACNPTPVKGQPCKVVTPDCNEIRMAGWQKPQDCSVREQMRKIACMRGNGDPQMKVEKPKVMAKNDTDVCQKHPSPAKTMNPQKPAMPGKEVGQEPAEMPNQKVANTKRKMKKPESMAKDESQKVAMNELDEMPWGA